MKFISFHCRTFERRDKIPPASRQLIQKLFIALQKYIYLQTLEMSLAFQLSIYEPQKINVCGENEIEMAIIFYLFPVSAMSNGSAFTPNDTFLM